ncbi:MAG: hypothetical protein HDR23_06890 [Lachnospiraceae bacterium]|nr:hypothetical protein [Lachnospiraceae bacterium]
MADIVNLQQSEYDPAIEKLAALHETAITKISKISEEIRELSDLEGGFYIDKISAKIAMLLNTLDSGITAPMSMNMDSSKMSMDSFAEIIANLDSDCGI